MQILLNKFEDLKANFTSIKSDIHSTIDEIRECLGIAKVEEGFPFDFPFGDDEVEELNSISLRQICLESLKEGDKVQENSENKAIFDALRESYKLLVTKHLHSVQEWISVLVRVDATDNKFRDTALKEFIDIRNLIQSVKKECTELGIFLDQSNTLREDDGLWEEGKIEAYEPGHSIASRSTLDDFLTKPSAKKSINKSPSVESESSVCKVSSESSVCKVSSESSVCKVSSLITDREKLLSDAPVLPSSPFFFDKWDAQRDALANHRGLEIEGHWGRVDPDAVIPAEKIAELNVHRTVYKEERVKIKPCLAPLKKGGLCQRRDLRVCPFHGPIIPRDKDGNPIKQDLHVSASDGKLSEQVGELTENESLSEPKHIKNEQTDLKGSLCSTKEMVEQLARQAVKNVRDRDLEAKSMKRAKCAMVRKHNEEVLRDAAIASTSYSEAFAAQSVDASHDNEADVKAKKPILASMLKKKVTAKDLIAQRLLNSRATDSSIRQLKLGQDSKYREAFPNQW